MKITHEIEVGFDSVGNPPVESSDPRMQPFYDRMIAAGYIADDDDMTLLVSGSFERSLVGCNYVVSFTPDREGATNVNRHAKSSRRIGRF